jgi:hypothetical protein
LAKEVRPVVHHAAVVAKHRAEEKALVARHRVQERLAA